MVKSDDPDLPSLVVTGDLPQLCMHVNEDKVYLKKIFQLLIFKLTEQWF